MVRQATQIDRAGLQMDDRTDLDVLTALVRMLRQKTGSLSVSLEASLPALRTSSTTSTLQ